MAVSSQPSIASTTSAVNGLLRMNRDANVYVDVVSEDGTELLGRSAINSVVARNDTEFLLGIGFSNAE